MKCIVRLGSSLVPALNMVFHLLYDPKDTITSNMKFFALKKRTSNLKFHILFTFWFLRLQITLMIHKYFLVYCFNPYKNYIP